MVKTLFLCDRKQDTLYLFVTPGNMPFSSQVFSATPGVLRVSFAPPEKTQPLLGTKIGTATVFSALLDPENRVHIVFGRYILAEKAVRLQCLHHRGVSEGAHKRHPALVSAHRAAYAADRCGVRWCCMQTAAMSR